MYINLGPICPNFSKIITMHFLAAILSYFYTKLFGGWSSTEKENLKEALESKEFTGYEPCCIDKNPRDACEDCLHIARNNVFQLMYNYTRYHRASLDPRQVFNQRLVRYMYFAPGWDYGHDEALFYDNGGYSCEELYNSFDAMCKLPPFSYEVAAWKERLHPKNCVSFQWASDLSNFADFFSYFAGSKTMADLRRQHRTWRMIHPTIYGFDLEKYRKRLDDITLCWRDPEEVEWWEDYKFLLPHVLVRDDNMFGYETRYSKSLRHVAKLKDMAVDGDDGHFYAKESKDLLRGLCALGVEHRRRASLLPGSIHLGRFARKSKYPWYRVDCEFREGELLLQYRFSRLEDLLRMDLRRNPNSCLVARLFTLDTLNEI